MTASQIEMFQNDPVTKHWVGRDSALQLNSPYKFLGKKPLVVVDPEGRDVTKADQLVNNTFLPSEVILRVSKKRGQDIAHIIKKKRLAKVCLKFILKVSILLI